MKKAKQTWGLVKFEDIEKERDYSFVDLKTYIANCPESNPIHNKQIVRSEDEYINLYDGEYFLMPRHGDFFKTPSSEKTISNVSISLNAEPHEFKFQATHRAVALFFK